GKLSWRNCAGCTSVQRRPARQCSPSCKGFLKRRRHKKAAAQADCKYLDPTFTETSPFGAGSIRSRAGGHTCMTERLASAFSGEQLGSRSTERFLDCGNDELLHLEEGLRDALLLLLSAP